MIFEIIVYVILALGFFTFLKVGRFEWNGRPISLGARLIIALIIPLVLIVTFMFLITLFTILALIIIILFIANYLQRRR